ncbi:MAG: aminotransferase class V-fold PLP-dependent enzyme [Spirochaetes bacterium]|nr:aminotransferase class V-fold PLP-dependent enzyme [Spirochaetota bacterium]
MESKTIHEKMFQEIKDPALFKQIQQYASEYIEQAFERNVYPEQSALANLKSFEEVFPEQSSHISTILKQLNEYGAPATVSEIGGRYFGFVVGGIVPAGLFARILTDCWDQNSAMQVLSPVSAKLEMVVEKWLQQLFHLPEQTAAGFVSGTSAATFSGLAAARYHLLKKLGWDINELGLYQAPQIRIVTGKEAHSTVLKAIGLLGLGKNHIEWVDTDDQGRIIPEKIPPLDNKTLVILQAGNVNSGSFDPFERICDQANAAGAWVHIDGAFGLWAAAVDDLKHLTKGMEKANSWSVDGHKTLNTPYDSGIILCKEREALVSALHMSGSYIVLGEERDPMFYTPEMSRRARIFEIWATMKFLGKAGINEMVGTLHKRALQFAKELTSHGFQILNKVYFNQVLVCCENDNITKATLENIQQQRVCWCGGAHWHGKAVIRISVCSWATTTKDVSKSVQSFIQARKSV